MATCALGVGETGLRVGKTFPIFDGNTYKVAVG